MPVRWSVMHMYSSSQLAKILALKRGMDPQLASIAAELHDIAVTRTKKTQDHAPNAQPFISEIIDKYNNAARGNLPEITEKEKEMIIRAVAAHSEKEIYSGDAFAELLKDIDSVDRYLHGVKTEGAYLERSRATLSELGINFSQES